MTTTNLQAVKSASQFFRYMVEVESHNGIDPRYLMTKTRGPVALGSFRRDFAKLMAGHDRSVQAVATLHSAAPGEMEKIARQIEVERGLEVGSLDKHDAVVIDRYMEMVVEAEDKSAPGTAGIYGAQIDGESGLLHVHGMRLNVMLRDVEVPVKRRVNEVEADGRTVVRDERGFPVPKRDGDGNVVYEETVESVKAGYALPPSMRDTLRARRAVDAVWSSHGLDNAGIVAPGKKKTWKDRARDYLRQLEATRETAMEPEFVLEAIRADGHEATLRGKKKQVLTLRFKDGASMHQIRTQNLDVPGSDAPSLAWAEFSARMAMQPAPEAVKEVEVERDVVEDVARVAAEQKVAASGIDIETLEDVTPTQEEIEAERRRIEIEEKKSRISLVLGYYDEDLVEERELLDENEGHNFHDMAAWNRHKIEIFERDRARLEQLASSGDIDGADEFAGAYNDRLSKIGPAARDEFYDALEAEERRARDEEARRQREAIASLPKPDVETVVEEETSEEEEAVDIFADVRARIDAHANDWARREAIRAAEKARRSAADD